MLWTKYSGDRALIRLTKTEEPDILRRNAVAWAQELASKTEAGEEPSKYLLGRYSHPDIKAALLTETHGKCAYCESPLRHVTYGDIEHIIPKSLRPSLRFSWDNLTIACDVCNTNKSNTDGLVDPYQCDPVTLFDFYGPLIWAKYAFDAAVLTEHRLDLNRPQLVERRRERIEYLRSLVNSSASKPREIRDAMLNTAKQEAGASKPFSACGTAALAHLLRE